MQVILEGNAHWSTCIVVICVSFFRVHRNIVPFEDLLSWKWKARGKTEVQRQFEVVREGHAGEANGKAKRKATTARDQQQQT